MSPLSNTSILYISELSIYTILLPLTLYLSYRHGRPAILGSLYLNIFCTLRIIADILEIKDRNNAPNHPSTTSSIVNSIGLSPLLLALAGIIHEAHHHQITGGGGSIKASSSTKTSTLKKWMWFAQIQIHLASMTGVILLVIGSVSLPSAKTESDRSKDYTLRDAGACLLFILWIVLCSYAVWLYRQSSRRGGSNNNKSVLQRRIKTLTLSILVAMPFVGVRSLYSVVYTFDHSPSVSPITGGFALKLVLVVLVQLFAVLALVVGYFFTRNIVREALMESSYSSSSLGNVNASYVQVRAQSPDELEMGRRGK